MESRSILQRGPRVLIDAGYGMTPQPTTGRLVTSLQGVRLCLWRGHEQSGPGARGRPRLCCQPATCHVRGSTVSIDKLGGH
jgi:hypothetical protein